jgi:hypothetical protein
METSSLQPQKIRVIIFCLIQFIFFLNKIIIFSYFLNVLKGFFFHDLVVLIFFIFFNLINL